MYSYSIADKRISTIDILLIADGYSRGVPDSLSVPIYTTERREALLGMKCLAQEHPGQFSSLDDSQWVSQCVSLTVDQANRHFTSKEMAKSIDAS